jgi:hypothetical protein
MVVNGAEGYISVWICIAFFLDLDAALSWSVPKAGHSRHFLPSVGLGF